MTLLQLVIFIIVLLHSKTRANETDNPILKIVDFNPIDSQKVNWTAKCDIYGYSANEIIWTFTPCSNFKINALPYCEDTKTKILENNLKYNSDSSNYSIINFMLFSSGIIKCDRKNGENTDSVNILIENIADALNISSSKSRNNINVGDKFNLTCMGLKFFYDLDWYYENQIVNSSYELFSDIEVFKESNEFYNTVTLKFENIQQSNKYECRGYKNSDKSLFQSQKVKIQVRESNVYVYYSLLFIPIIIIFIFIMFIIFYFCYLKKKKQLPSYDEIYEFPDEKIKMEKKLGNGAFGVVFKAVAERILPNESETTVAIKTIEKKSSNKKTLRALESELEILLSVGKHLNLVNLLGIVTKEPLNYKLMVILEFCEYGNVKNFLLENRIYFVNQIDPKTGFINKNINSETYDNQNNPMELTTSTLLLWAYQIACGMGYVSSQNVLHGGLSARNILLSHDNIVKISDFGLAKSINYTYKYKLKRNSPLPIQWLAFETLESGLFSRYSDVWSYGILLWEFFTLCKDPYERLPVDWFGLLEQLKSGYRMARPYFSNNEIYNIILECWMKDPKKRPTFIELEKRFKNLIDLNIAEYYIKLNDLYRNENKKTEQNLNKIDNFVQNNLENTTNSPELPNKIKTYIKNLPASKSFEHTNLSKKQNHHMDKNLKSSKKLTYEEESKAAESERNSNIVEDKNGYIDLKSFKKPMDEKQFKSDELKINSNTVLAPVQNQEKNSSINENYINRFSSHEDIKDLNKDESTFNGYTIMSPSVRNINPFAAAYKEKVAEDILIKIGSEDEIPLEIGRKYENVDFSVKSFETTQSYENIDTVLNPAEQKKYRTLHQKPNSSASNYLQMKPIPKQRTFKSLEEL